MQKEKICPGLSKDTDTLTLVPGLGMQGYYVLLLRNHTP